MTSLSNLTADELDEIFQEADKRDIEAICECEHISHTQEEHELEERALTPNGHDGHIYGTTFEPHLLVTVDTNYGRLTICRDCQGDCHPAAGKERC